MVHRDRRPAVRRDDRRRVHRLRRATRGGHARLLVHQAGRVALGRGVARERHPQLAARVVARPLIVCALPLAGATLAFWFIRLDAWRWVVMSLENDFTRYPLSIYSRSVRIVLGYVFPLAIMNYFPATALLHKTAEATYALNPVLGWLTPVVGAVWFGAAYLFWRRGL